MNNPNNHNADFSLFYFEIMSH